MSKNQHTTKTTDKGTPIVLDQDNSMEALVNTQKYVRRNRIIFGMLGGVFILAITGYFLYTYLQSSQEKEAQEQMFAAVYWLQANDNKKALKGDNNYMGFEGVIKNYPLSKAANLAYFYAGTAQLKEGLYKEAIVSLRKFSANDWLVQARAYSLIADANMELNQYNEAISYYEKASDYKVNKQFTPIYLSKLALAYEKAKNIPSAIKTYELIIKEYPNTNEYFNAKKHQARLETSQAK